MLHETQQEFPVESKSELFVQCSAGFFPKRPTPEHRFLRNVVRPSQHLAIKGRQYPAPNFSPELVNKDAVAINQIDIWPTRKKGGNVIERTGKENVIRIEPAHDFTG